MAESTPEMAEFIKRRQCRIVLAYLARAPRENLVLIEQVREMDRFWGGSTPQMIAVWREDEVVGVVSLRPSISIDAYISPEALTACLPLLACVESGLIKSRPDHAERVWKGLRVRGRRSLLDRKETAYFRESGRGGEGLPGPPNGAVLRPAEPRDLEYLVDAARASLREESRPDPFDGDPIGFRRWVAGRVSRARVVECDDRPVFVCYADVRQPDGWLIQGVYTWPHARRQGYARAGMAAVVREAEVSGADHVQLAVVAGNGPAIELYQGLGFRAFGDLRTLLFS